MFTVCFIYQYDFSVNWTVVSEWTKFCPLTGNFRQMNVFCFLDISDKSKLVNWTSWKKITLVRRRLLA